MNFIRFLDINFIPVIALFIIIGITTYIFGIRLVKHDEHIWSAILLSWGNFSFCFALFTYACHAGWLG